MSALRFPFDSEGFPSLKSLSGEGSLRNLLLFVEPCYRIQILVEKTDSQYEVRINKEGSISKYVLYFQTEAEAAPKLVQKGKSALFVIEQFANEEDQTPQLSEAPGSGQNAQFQSGLVGPQARQRFKTIHHHFSKLQGSVKS